jgi:DNA-directed RNA polymerase subunit RPC12/RpoP
MTRCDECGYALTKDVLEMVRQIAALPEAVGEHACDSGHPQMRLLPDGSYRCPACGSEVLPSELT